MSGLEEAGSMGSQTVSGQQREDTRPVHLSQWPRVSGVCDWKWLTERFQTLSETMRLRKEAEMASTLRTTTERDFEVTALPCCGVESAFHHCLCLL